jgi:hypothetical protein
LREVSGLENWLVFVRRVDIDGMPYVWKFQGLVLKSGPGVGTYSEESELEGFDEHEWELELGCGSLYLVGFFIGHVGH